MMGEMTGSMMREMSEKVKKEMHGNEAGKTLYLECASGISGDMTVAALLDLGADEVVLEKVLHSLPVDGFVTEISRVKKSGLDVCDFSVKLDEKHENHDHDMEYLYGKEEKMREIHEHHPADTGKIPEHHKHEGGHLHGVNSVHTHEHRGLPEIETIINQAEMTEGARSLALKIFYILAEAEAKAHGVPVNQVHFHEVGAVDSIVDIVAAAVCFDNLGIRGVIIPQLCEGSGFVRCQHGILPVPVPAVANIAQSVGLKLHITDTDGELVTPTGAAIAAAICTSSELPDSFTIEKIGIGAGKRTYDRPSLLRAMLISDGKKNNNHETAPKKKTDISDACSDRDRIYRLESNMDDCTGESLGYVMEQLLAAGARDVNYTPIFMKKNRPGYQLNVICDLQDVKKMETIIFRETTTIGIRRMEMERTILPRASEKIKTSIGEAQIKKCTLPDGTVRYYPEYSSIKELARINGISFQEAFGKVQCAVEN